MECECGSARMTDASAKRSKAGVELSYRVCSTCGRNEYVALLVRGRVVATGVEAQREFLAMEEGAQPAAPAPVVTPAIAAPMVEAWRPVSETPPAGGLVRVRFIAGGHFIERPSFFDGRWDLIDAWHPYDNGPALATSHNPPPIPAALRAGSLTPEPKRAARPLPTPPTQPDVQRGMTLSLF